jgi:hypothetical protein
MPTSLGDNVDVNGDPPAFFPQRNSHLWKTDPSPQSVGGGPLPRGHESVDGVPFFWWREVVINSATRVKVTHGFWPCNKKSKILPARLVCPQTHDWRGFHTIDGVKRAGKLESAEGRENRKFDSDFRGAAEAHGWGLGARAGVPAHLEDGGPGGVGEPRGRKKTKKKSFPAILDPGFRPGSPSRGGGPPGPAGGRGGDRSPKVGPEPLVGAGKLLGEDAGLG